MLTLTMNADFAIGDTAPAEVNGKQVSVTWVDEWTVRLGDDDIRHVIITMAANPGDETEDNKHRTFFCTSAEKEVTNQP